MTLARLALFIAVYVSLDVSNPLLPGALTFADQSVEVRQADRFRGQNYEAVPAPRAPEPERLEPADQSRPVRRPLPPETLRSRWAQVARSHLSLPAAASSSEDH
jgi:hypothetical protein